MLPLHLMAWQHVVSARAHLLPARGIALAGSPLPLIGTTDVCVSPNATFILRDPRTFRWAKGRICVWGGGRGGCC